MPYKDLREFISKLEDEGELKRVKAEVDWNLELCTVAKLNEEERGPALLFENVKGYKTPVLTSAFSTPKGLALALDLPKTTPLVDTVKIWVDRMKKKIAPVYVSDAPCKENIDKGDEVNILKFPVPKWYEGDGGRYIGTTCCIITRDIDTGWVNVGTHRMMVQDEKSTGIWMIPGKHIQLQHAEYAKRKERMPVAVAIGVDPIVFLCSSAPFPISECEYDYMGGIRGEPLELTKAETVDLPVPASAEVILEGYVDPAELKHEGPYGEYSGHYQAAYPKPLFRVECVTYRNNPIHWGCTTGMPITDIHMLQTLNRSALLWSDLERMGIPGIRGVCCPPETGGYFTAIVSIKQLYLGHSNQVATACVSAASGNYSTKLVVIVDDDIDPSNLSQVWWAMGMRYQPDRDTNILTRGRCSPIDPALPIGDKNYTSRILIDATIPFEWEEGNRPEVVRLNDDVVKKVKGNWKGYFGD
jgi:phenylphosphate carboxylase beta subunit